MSDAPLRLVTATVEPGARLVVEPGTAPAVAGMWRNELGSVLRLTGISGGGLAGTYESAVGEEHGARPLVGFHGAPQADRSIVIGFVVRLPVAGSIATWTGRYDPDSQVIRTTWLLVTESDAADAWSATRVGADEFHRAGAEHDGDSWGEGSLD